MAVNNKRPAAASRRPKKKQRSKGAGAGGDARIREEILLLAVLAFCVLLLISNFGLGGIVGRTLSTFFFGVFGFPSYAFPVLLLIAFLFGISNGQNPRAIRKLTGASLLYLFICSLFQLLMYGFDKNARIVDYYIDSASDRLGGGITGGLITRLFGSLFGTIGTFIFVVIALIICAIIMTQEPLLRIMRDRGQSAYRTVRTRRSVSSKAKRPEAKKKAGFFRRRRTDAVDDTDDYAEEEVILPESEPAVAHIRVRGASDQNSSDITEEEMTPVNTDSDLIPPPEITPEERPARKSSRRRSAPIREFSILPSGEENSESAPAGSPSKRKRRSAAASEVSADSEYETYLSEPAETRPAKNASRTAAPRRKQGKYSFPPITLLEAGSGNDGGETTAQLNETAARLQKTLHDFGVEVQITDVSRGPSVTRFEIHPETGVKVSRILSLQDDIKLNLAAADIRIEAPIPGKSAIGIEVPNKSTTTVTLRELLASRTYRQSKAKLAFAVGKDIAGKPVIADLAKMPHVLIAGATGSGKSVCINTLIMSILYKSSPEEMKFIMIDPKMVELSVYNGIPHLFIPVVTDPKKAAGALNWAVSEMTDRYNKFAGMKVRDLKSYNAKIDEMEDPEDGSAKPEKMPSIVIIVDELADLMMVAQHEVEDAIVRLSQLARAAGIHLVIATQRPSVNVITGLIKANMPSRIALAVTSGVDSRTILDMNGAEKLIGNGDMLFYPQGFPKPARVQGAFVSEEEITRVVSFLTEQNEPGAYNEEVEKQISTAGISSDPALPAQDERDTYFVEAGKLIIEKDKASIGMLQRAFKIGFNRAARIMDQLCELGVVGEEEGTKPRRILMDMETFLEAVKES